MAQHEVVRTDLSETRLVAPGVDHVSGRARFCRTGRALIAIRDAPIAASAMGINVSLYKSLPFDTEKDFLPIAMINSNPLVLVGRKTLEAKTLPELVAAFERGTALRAVAVVTATVLASAGAACSGVDYDLRRDQHLPMAWDKVDWKVWTHPDGDSFARYWVRLQEVREACHMVDQLLDSIPAGPIMANILFHIGTEQQRHWAALSVERKWGATMVLTEPPEVKADTIKRSPSRCAPVKVAVLPLVRKDGQPELAREIHRELRELMQSEYDEGGAIGRLTNSSFATTVMNMDDPAALWAVSADDVLARPGGAGNCL